jgi:hypothetical protein
MGYLNALINVQPDLGGIECSNTFAACKYWMDKLYRKLQKMN